MASRSRPITIAGKTIREWAQLVFHTIEDKKHFTLDQVKQILLDFELRSNQARYLVTQMCGHGWVRRKNTAHHAPRKNKISRSKRRDYQDPEPAYGLTALGRKVLAA